MFYHVLTCRRPALEDLPLNRLDRYIFSQSLRPLALITLCVSAVIWLTQLLQRVDLIVDDGGSLSAFLRIAILILPSLLVIIIPFAVLATTLYLLNRLMGDSEIAVMKSAGASRWRVARPLIFLGLLASLITLWINVDLMPRSYRQLKNIVHEVRADIARSLIRSGEFSSAIDGMMVHAEEVMPGGQFKGLLIYDFRDPEKPVTYMAESGLYRDSDYGPRLHLARGNIQRTAKDGYIEIVRFDETAVDMTDYQTLNIETVLEETERYVSELLHPDLTQQYDRAHAGRLIAEGHARLTTPLYALFFVILSAALMLRAPFNRFGYSRIVRRVIVIAILVRVFGYFLQSLAADMASMNMLQYLWPLGAIAVSLAFLLGLDNLGRRSKNQPLLPNQPLDDAATERGQA